MKELRGLHRDIRVEVERRIAGGWAFDRLCATGHVWLRWPATGETVCFPGSPSDRRSLLNARADAYRIDGTKPHHHGPRFRKVRGSGFRLDGYVNEQQRARVEDLCRQLAQVDADLVGVDPRREQGRARRLAARRVQLAEQLAELHQPVPTPPDAVA